MTLLAVDNLSVSFGTEEGRATVVENVSFSIETGQVVGLVGESGCGKSVTAMSLLRLLPAPPSRIDGGRVLFEGKDLLQLSERQLRALRGDRIGFIFQEPMTSLNPTFSIGFQLTEALRLHRDVGQRAAEAAAAEMLRLVGVSAPQRRLKQYPHELSGGLRQRVMIAMALICRPGLLIADEPTTALDVTIQAQILDLLASLKRDLGMAILLITHDLGVVAEFCETVVVMYAGRVVETATVQSLFATPRHPYTIGLMASIPRLTSGKDKLPTIPGLVPSPGQRPPGCYFADRCPRVVARCRDAFPPLTGPEADGPTAHRFACWNPSP